MIFHIKRVYLDHNATTPLDPTVKSFMSRNMQKFNGNPSSLHTVGRQAKYLLEEARNQIADLLSVMPEKIIFTSGGTEGNNTILKGVFAKEKFSGTLIISALEHESILGAAAQLEEYGVKVIQVRNVYEIEKYISNDVKLISIMHGNNETGIINPLSYIGKICQKHNILFHVDAVQTFGKIPVKPDDFGCDFMTISSHKINGPKGCGALFIRDFKSIDALIYGGDQEHALRAGTENIHAIAGFGFAATLRKSRMEKDFSYLQQFRKEFINGLRMIYPEVKVNQAAEQLPGTISLTFPGENNLKLLAALDCYGVEVSIGSACTADRIVPSHVLLGMGFDEDYALSTIRISASASNSMNDLRYILKVFREIRDLKLDNFSYLMPEHLTKSRRQNAYLIDIRWPYERVLRKPLPEANEVNALRFEAWSKKVPRNKEIIIICSTGVISGLNGYKLARKGYDVKVIYGGYAALPLED